MGSTGLPSQARGPRGRVRTSKPHLGHTPLAPPSWDCRAPSGSTGPHPVGGPPTHPSRATCAEGELVGDAQRWSWRSWRSQWSRWVAVELSLCAPRADLHAAAGRAMRPTPRPTSLPNRPTSGPRQSSARWASSPAPLEAHALASAATVRGAPPSYRTQYAAAHVRPPRPHGRPALTVPSPSGASVALVSRLPADRGECCCGVVHVGRSRHAPRSSLGALAAGTPTGTRWEAQRQE